MILFVAASGAVGTMAALEWPYARLGAVVLARGVTGLLARQLLGKSDDLRNDPFMGANAKKRGKDD